MTLPWRTLGLCLTLALLYAIAGAAPESLVFARERVFAGEVWRLLSAHLAHSGPAHLGWNLAALATIGGLFERRLGTRLWPTLGIGIASVDVLLLIEPRLHAYCGLSGVLNTLLGGLLIELLADPTLRRYAALTLLGMILKIGAELAGGHALLTHTAWPAYPPAHLAGLLGAMIHAAFIRRPVVTPAHRAYPHPAPRQSHPLPWYPRGKGRRRPRSRGGQAVIRPSRPRDTRKPMPSTSLLDTQVNKLLHALRLPDAYRDLIDRYHRPLARAIAQQRASSTDAPPLLVSISGVQGSGKTTLSTFLELLLRMAHGLRVARISIDDFCHTRATRERLSRELHPLLITRGPPGTHDLSLAVETLSRLREARPGQSCPLPRFDKGCDDRLPESRWDRIHGPFDIILFEGWCNHAPPQSDAELREPINTLERDEDRDGLWRGYVNESLREYQRHLYADSDLLILLRAPDFQCVYPWRALQERKLADEIAASGARQAHRRPMDEHQLKRFIQHFERVSRHALATLPETADVVLELDEKHRIRHMRTASGDPLDAGQGTI